jgi:hypothetical protein
MNAVVFSLRGMAPVSGGSRRWEWRRRLRDTAFQARPGDRPAAPFHVSLVFHLVAHRLAAADVDRLATPVLDTLFASRNVQGDQTLTGALFPDFEDAAVASLEVRKVEASGLEEEGIDVRVTWT